MVFKENINLEDAAKLFCGEETKEVIIFGAGLAKDEFLKEIGVEVKYKYCVDNDVKKQIGEVYSPLKLREATSDDVVIITTVWVAPILEQLEELNFAGKVYSFPHMKYHTYFALEMDDYKNEINELMGLLADEKSRGILSEICRKRKEQSINYLNIYEENQYFVEGIIKQNPEAIFVDAGAYDGANVDEFILFSKNEFKKIYSFEMDENNYRNIDKGKYDKRVNFLNCGLWDKKELCVYSACATTSTLSEEGESHAECVMLDEIVGEDEKITFIKMDIEGAEKKALIGAKKCIKRDKPQLAICIYHKFADLWEIPLLIHEWVPEYKLYIRHHGPAWCETVLYAVLE